MANRSFHTAALAKQYADKYQVSLEEASRAIKRSFAVVSDALCAGNDVTVYKFGRFKRIHVPAKATKQPGTDHYSSIPDHTLIHFVKSRNVDFDK